MSDLGDPFLFALIADGPSDRALVPILRWALRQQEPSLRLQPPLFEPRRPAGADLRVTVERLVTAHRPDLVFVHRDAENLTHEARKAEIPQLDGVVPVVPVRMTEAWLLIDERAIRIAAGNPNGTMALALPPVQRLERLPDPKEVLRALLMEASGRRGRRRQHFKETAAVQRVADFLADPSALRQLAAFRELETDLARALQARRRSL